MDSDFGLWTRRMLALLVILYVGYALYIGQIEGQSIKEMALMVLACYFAVNKGET
jgi:hypothetical protein